MNVIKNYINKVLKCYPNKVVQCNVYNKNNMEGIKHHDFSQIVTSQMWTSRDLTINGLTIIWVYSYESLVGVILDGTIETVTHDSRHYPLTFIDFYYDLPTWARTVATRQQGVKLKRMIEEAHGSIYNYKDWLIMNNINEEYALSVGYARVIIENIINDIYSPIYDY